MDLITSHISHVLLNSSSVVCGKLVDFEDVAEVQLEIDEELMLGAGELGRGVGETSWNTEGSYTGTRTERCMKGILLRHAWIARAYEETWARFRGGGRIATETFKYEAYANSCKSAYENHVRRPRLESDWGRLYTVSASHLTHSS